MKLNHNQKDIITEFKHIVDNNNYQLIFSFHLNLPTTLSSSTLSNIISSLDNSLSLTKSGKIKFTFITEHDNHYEVMCILTGTPYQYLPRNVKLKLDEVINDAIDSDRIKTVSCVTFQSAFPMRKITHKTDIKEREQTISIMIHTLITSPLNECKHHYLIVD